MLTAGIGQATAQSPTSEVAQLGAQFFQHTWKAGQPASPGGDGLGPVHNDVSCVACHNQGGLGGAGPVEKNVSMLSLGKRPSGMSRRRFHQAAVAIHPGFEASPVEVNRNLVLHKFSTDTAYNLKRMRFVGTDIPVNVLDEFSVAAERLVATAPVRRISHPTGLPLQLSQRSSPALFGAGLIDQIPDVLLIRLAKRQNATGKVSGRVSEVSGGIGRFGWRGQTAHLAEFVRDACANELGLQVPGADQAMHPLHAEYEPDGLDLSAPQLMALTTFVSQLPRPLSVTPTDERLHTLVKRGKSLFADIGCADCHVETIGGSSAVVREIYSDLLLHDMGPKLADPVLPTPQTVFVKKLVLEGELRSPPRTRRSGGGSYGGGGGGVVVQPTSSSQSSPPVSFAQIKSKTVPQVVPTNLAQEWRTPPLWGVRASAPYLHDGRASTLTEAILYHGGEALPSVKNFLRLSPAKRTAVVEFLHTLEPPDLTSLELHEVEKLTL